MEKTTQLLCIKVRWLNTKTKLLFLFACFLHLFQVHAQTFNYTGAVQQVTLPAGSYQIEMWGADGGGGFHTSLINNEGKGGYTKGILNVTSSTTYYIYVGGKGTNASDIGAGAVYVGGWNGGGDSGANNYSTLTQYRAGGGGGGTDIRTTQNTTYANRIMVASGGGGGVYSTTYPGGNGGGTSGGNGGNTYNGDGGTQSAGGTANGSTGNIAGTNGVLGVGGNGGSSSTKSAGGGGGGGYYGGGGGATGNSTSSQGGGGGGSSYFGGISAGITFMFGETGYISNPDTAGNGTVTITSIASCAGTPTAGTAAVTARTCLYDPFTLSATGSTKAGNITYQWQSAPSATGPWTDITGATNFIHTVTNQTATTYYRFMVTCTNGGGTDITNVVSVTQTALANLYENFDTTATGSTSTATYPSCWSYIDDITTTGYGYVEAATAQSLANSFRLYRTNTTTNAAQNLVLISPQTDNLGNGTKQLRFYAMATNTNATNILQIVRANGTTASDTFTVIQSIVVNHTDYKEYIVHLPVTTDDYFGFRLASNGGTATVDINIDDVYYEDLDTCLYPTGVTIPTVTQTTADISWTASTSTSVTAYEYEVRSLGAPGSGTMGLGATGITPNAATLTATATGLSPSVNYTVYVRSICGTSTGKWTPINKSFYTLCGSVTAVFAENFDTTATGSSSNNSVPSCWSFLDEVTTSGYGYVEAATAQSLANSFRLYRTNTTGNAAENIVLISPETDNLGNGTKQLRFSAMATNTNAVNVLQIVSSNGTTASSAFTVIQNVVVNHTGYEEYIVPLPVTTDDYFGFRLASNGTTTTVDINIDDVYYENLSPCIYPMNIQVGNITETTAALSWTASLATGVTGYEYEIRSSGAPGSGSTGLGASGSTTAPTVTANITGLTGATDYVVYVRSVCGTSSGAWTLFPVNFQTDCPVYVNNFFEGFESTATGSASNNTVPLCWAYIGDTSGYYGYTSTDSSRTGSNGFRYYKTTANAAADLLLVSPETNNLGNGTKQLRFWVKVNSGTANVPVYTLDGNTGTAAKTQIALIAATTTWTEYSVTFPITTNDYFAIGFLDNSSSTQLLLDDVYYEDVPAPTLAASHTDILCNGAATGTATAVVTNGALPLTYSWSPSGGTADTATGLTAGTYTVTVTDGLNRTDSATVTVTEPTAIVSGVTSTNSTCNGANNGSITLAPTGGTAPYTYLWSTNDTGTSITGLSAGTYSVDITDANGCVVTENVTITEPAVLTVASSSYTDVTWYGGNDGSATVSVTGGTAPYTYSWAPSGGTADTATGLVAGTYTVTVTDANGCTVTESFTIIQPIPLMVQSTSQTNAKCNGGADGTATIVAMGGNAPYTYSWTPSGGTNATATGLTAGTYTVTVTDATSNTITESFTITEPGAITPILSHQSDVLCNGASNGSATITVTGGTAPFTYTWSNGLVTNNATVSNLKSGTYTVTVTDANGCTAATTVAITISQPAALVFTTTSSTNVSCYGQNDGSATVVVSGGVGPYSYSWSNGQSGTSLSNLGRGTYVVTVTDANNCTQTHSFTITEPAFVPAPAAVSQNFCAGQNATLADIVISGSNIKWYSAATGGTLLATTTAVVSGSTYYASQTVGTCESTTRTAVQVVVNQAQALTTTQLNVCSNTRIQNMIVDGFNYTQLRWYSSSTSTIQLAPNILLATGTYYVSSYVGNCESARQAIQVTVAAVVPAPTAAFQTVCGGATLNDLVVTKDPSATLNWYSSAQSMIPLVNTTPVATGTYYVQQVIGNCESSRIAVQVQVIANTVPTISAINTCEGTTIADLNVNGTNYVWYTDNTTPTALPGSYMITSGSYYIANQNASCISARKNIAVNVSPRPANATGAATQHFEFSAKVSDLKMNEPNVKWFASANDAATMTNELAATTLLTDQTTYYGILTNANNCGSVVPTAVTVTLNLSNKELDLTQLKYYPNPVDGELNISYMEEITKVEIFTITGQKVLSNTYQNNEVKVDLSRLSSGTYLVKLETAKASQFVKVVKK